MDRGQRVKRCLASIQIWLLDLGRAAKEGPRGLRGVEGKKGDRGGEEQEKSQSEGQEGQGPGVAEPLMQHGNSRGAPKGG